MTAIGGTQSPRVPGQIAEPVSTPETGTCGTAEVCGACNTACSSKGRQDSVDVFGLFPNDTRNAVAKIVDGKVQQGLHLAGDTAQPAFGQDHKARAALSEAVLTAIANLPGVEPGKLDSDRAASLAGQMTSTVATMMILTAGRTGFSHGGQPTLKSVLDPRSARTLLQSDNPAVFLVVPTDADARTLQKLNASLDLLEQMAKVVSEKMGLALNVGFIPNGAPFSSEPAGIVLGAADSPQGRPEDAHLLVFGGGGQFAAHLEQFHLSVEGEDHEKRAVIAALKLTQASSTS